MRLLFLVVIPYAVRIHWDAVIKIGEERKIEIIPRNYPIFSQGVIIIQIIHTPPQMNIKISRVANIKRQAAHSR